MRQKKNKFKQQAHRNDIKTKKGGKYENQHEIVWEKYVHISKNQVIAGNIPLGAKKKKIYLQI